MIATRVGGIPDAIRDQVEGLLIPPRDSDALIRAIEFMINNSRIASEMGLRAKERVSQEFTVGRIAESTARMYHELVS